MTFQPPQNSGGPRGFALGLIVGLSVGLGLLAVGGAVSWRYAKSADARARKGWNLVTVVVAAVDISEGTVVTVEMINQRAVPEQFVTASVVKPDSASYVVGQKTNVPLQAGDLLLWSSFETKKEAARP